MAAPEGTVFADAFVEAVVAEYLSIHLHLDDPGLAPALISFRYDDLLDPRILRRLRDTTGCRDISPENFGLDRRASATVEWQAVVGDNPCLSPKYDSAIQIDKRVDSPDPRYSRCRRIVHLPDRPSPLRRFYGAVQCQRHRLKQEYPE